MKPTLRSRVVLARVAGVYILALLASLWILLGPRDGTRIVGSAIAITILWLSALVLALLAREKRRGRVIAAGRPGWTVIPALTTRAQVEAMRASGRKAVLGVAATLAWGPDGVGMWTLRRGKAERVFEYSWTEVLDIAEADDLTTNRGYPTMGIRIRLVNGTGQDVRAAASRSIRAAHPDATIAGALAATLMDARGGLTGSRRPEPHR